MEISDDVLGYEACALCINVPIAHAALAMGVESLRDHEMQLVLRTGHCDIKQAALFFCFVRSPGAEVRRNATVHGV